MPLPRSSAGVATAAIGERRHLVNLQNPGPSVPDGDGGFSQAWANLVPATMWASITPATQRDLERVVAGTVQSTATHIVTMRFHSGVNTKTRLTKGPRNADGTLPVGSREFSVIGVANPEERNIDLVLVCVEAVL